MYDTQFSAKVRSKAGDAHHTQESFFTPFQDGVLGYNGSKTADNVCNKSYIDIHLAYRVFFWRWT